MSKDQDLEIWVNISLINGRSYIGIIDLSDLPKFKKIRDLYQNPEERLNIINTILSSEEIKAIKLKDAHFIFQIPEDKGKFRMQLISITATPEGLEPDMLIQTKHIQLIQLLRDDSMILNQILHKQSQFPSGKYRKSKPNRTKSPASVGEKGSPDDNVIIPLDGRKPRQDN